MKKKDENDLKVRGLLFNQIKFNPDFQPEDIFPHILRVQSSVGQLVLPVIKVYFFVKLFPLCYRMIIV